MPDYNTAKITKDPQIPQLTARSGCMNTKTTQSKGHATQAATTKSQQGHGRAFAESWAVCCTGKPVSRIHPFGLEEIQSLVLIQELQESPPTPLVISSHKTGPTKPPRPPAQPVLQSDHSIGPSQNTLYLVQAVTSTGIHPFHMGPSEP